MKKKLLSLVLAGAMVASTSVSTFAEELKTIDVTQGSGNDVDVSITGNIANKNGDVLPGTVSVTVPTSAVFNVDNNGNLNSAAMNIVNNGEQDVLVFASSFTDTTGDNEIKLVSEENLASSNSKKDVFLKLTGGKKDIYFTSEDENGNKGKIYDSATKSGLVKDNEIATVRKKDKVELRLKGKGSTNGTALESGVSDSFKLVLKIKQASKPGASVAGPLR